MPEFVADDVPEQASAPLPVAEAAPPVCRAFFPLTTEATYLDTGSAGLAFVGQEEAAARFYEDKFGGYIRREAWLAKAGAVRTLVAELVGVSTEAVEFVSGTTEGLNMVAHAIDWRVGDEIVVAADEFPSVCHCWHAAERAGAIVKLVPIPAEDKREEALAAALSDRTRVLCVAHVHSNTGTRLDLDRLGALCRRHDALFVVDGIHALGAVPVRLDQVDVYCAGVFKWLLGGFGLGVIIRSDRARADMEPPFRGYLNPSPDRGFECAHVNYPGLYALEAALRLMGEQIGWEVVQSRTAALVEWLADDLGVRGMTIAAPNGARAGLASVYVSGSEALKSALAHERIHVAAKGPLIRATPYFYNSRDDVRRFAETLGRLTRH